MELSFKEEQTIDNSLLILDDDDVFRNRLLSAMNKKGFKKRRQFAKFSKITNFWKIKIYNLIHV